MKIAVFSHTPLKREAVKGAQCLPLTGLGAAKLEEYDAVLLIGSGSLDEETVLTAEESHALWHYVKRGGKLYAELIGAFDFPSSRLLGWKQDFRKSRRTLEKLRTTAANSCGLPPGSILEWDGAFALGFPVDAEVLLELGPFRDTHVSAEAEGVKVCPALSVRPLGEGLVAFAAFSLFGSAAAAPLRPYSRWASVVRGLAARTGIPFELWEPPVALSGEESAAEAAHKSAQWFLRSGMLPEADGSGGLYENIHSVTGEVSRDFRPDCHAHAALMFYLYGRYSGQEEWVRRSHALLEFLFQGGYQELDPSSPSYGFFKWYQFPDEQPYQMFTDDNAWVCLALLYLYRKTGVEEYKRRGLLVAEAMLATQHPTGLRHKLMLGPQLQELGRERAALELEPSLNPHFESIAHTAFIQAYLVTGDSAYLETAVKGSKELLRRRDEFWLMYSHTSGYGRFMLPLAYLQRFDDSGELGEGLKQVAEYLLAHKHSSGAVQEADNPDPDRFGLEDAGVFIHNGEGIADQLYTNNFLLMNVWEAWKSTGDESYKSWYRELAAFLCRIQLTSGDPRYDGGWMRAFALELGEYFGNNGDTGWGPYCMESGWTNAMIPVGLLLGLLDESIFD
ncbi:hypothetical protein SAMN02799630_02164 [Paenibacillus sp. UNCCL117]|uniref:hypothetical protein n=1 Tax=unclassified Paenibacillus TaxID=185978 RepID=UPI000885C3D4|nr:MULTISPECIES: hypothetical protein [unclassified Paenibacillus]SDD12365.1 hypothetical protein SAMN04488602_10640 [Paenibacillus sp. cl123]SFW33772.1 hypothetical protein SAMN02799630_02164 [Paenibacillus sp. UNCCL117]